MEKLEELLEWAKDQSLYTEIFADGSVSVSYQPNPSESDNYCHLGSGDDLREALNCVKISIEDLEA